jgi:predicted dehydrogenase
MDRLNIAIAGLGRMVGSQIIVTREGHDVTDEYMQGKRHVHTLLYRVPHAQVVAVCSTEAHEVEWAQSNDEYKEFGITVYSKYEDMLAHPGLQAVWISTSTDVHARQTLAAIGKRVHVLCEKPLSTDLEEVRIRLSSDKPYREIDSTVRCATGAVCRRYRQSASDAQGDGRFLATV